MFVLVRSASVEIAEGDELYILEGSDLELRCIIKVNGSERTGFISWLHNAAYIPYNYTKRIDNDRNIEFILNIPDATDKHAGNYTCSPLYAPKDYIMVHVIKGRSILFNIPLY